jgi:hypothetical protein
MSSLRYHFSFLNVTHNRYIERSQMVWQSDDFKLLSPTPGQNKTWFATPELLKNRTNQTDSLELSHSPAKGRDGLVVERVIGLLSGVMVYFGVQWYVKSRKRGRDEYQEYAKPELKAKDVPRPVFETDGKVLHEPEAERIYGIEHELDSARSPVEVESPEARETWYMDDVGRQGGAGSSIATSASLKSNQSLQYRKETYSTVYIHETIFIDLFWSATFQ